MDNHTFRSTDGLYCSKCSLPKANRHHKGDHMSIGSLEALITGAGKVTVEHHGITSEGRTRFRYWIEDGSGRLLVEAADDLSLGVGQPASHVVALSTVLSFLLAAAESYEHSMRHRIDLSETENGTLFDKDTTEWAYQWSDEISMAASELEGE